MSLLPPEIWARITIHLPIQSYFALSKTCRSLASLLHQPSIRKTWLLAYFDGQRSDALIFAYRYKLMDVVKALIVSAYTGSVLQECADAFTQIACQEVRPSLI
jgi:hypothetical protein